MVRSVIESRLTFRESKEESYLLIGTSTGHLQLHGSDAQLLHRQRLHARAVTAISVRCAGMQAGSDNASEDITICFEDAVARVSSLEVAIPPRSEGQSLSLGCLSSKL